MIKLEDTENKEGDIMQIDPVCLMEIDEGAELKTEYKGKTYYFCAEFFLKKFKENPEDYLVRHEDFINKWT